MTTSDNLTLLMMRKEVYLALLSKSGVREWVAPEAHQALWEAAILAVDELNTVWIEESIMALPDTFKVSEGTAKTIKSSGGNAMITVANLANGNGTTTGARQSTTLDLGALWARTWRLDVNREFVATPTAGAVVNYFASWQSASGVGLANTSGSDAAYTGYAGNIDAATKQLDYLGSHICTAQATANVQKSFVSLVFPKGRYMNLVEDNKGGAAFHSTDTNQVITLTPLEETIEE